jgi:hypothetical protein
MEAAVAGAVALIERARGTTQPTRRQALRMALRPRRK